MAFVPEGQHDSSQARSTWNYEQNSPVPAGRLNRSQQEYLGFLKQHKLGFDNKYPWD